jgi:hypothetical protein
MVHNPRSIGREGCVIGLLTNRLFQDPFLI